MHLAEKIHHDHRVNVFKIFESPQALLAEIESSVARYEAQTHAAGSKTFFPYLKKERWRKGIVEAFERNAG